MPNLFVYGSLRDGFFNHHFLGLATASRFVTIARLPGTRLYRRGRYPVMVLDGGPEDMVEGEIYADVRPEVLETIRSVELSSGFVEAEAILKEIPCLLFAFCGSVAPADRVPSGKWEDAAPTLNVGILLFPGVNTHDALGCKEVFSSWYRGKERMEVFSVGSSVHDCGLMQAHYQFAQSPPIDILIVPGHPGQNASSDLFRFITSQRATAICTLSLSSEAADTEVLKGGVVSTSEEVPGNLVPGAWRGVEGALSVLAQLYGTKVTQEHARALGYNWIATEPHGRTDRRWIINRGAPEAEAS